MGQEGMPLNAEQRNARNAKRREQRAQDPHHRAEDNARQRAYYQAHKEKFRERASAYYQAHREEIGKRNSAYYQANKESISEQARASRLARKHANDPSLWSGELRRRYGMSPAEYAALLAKQGGACAICRKRSKGRLCVDHCHLTGTVRGLLCRKCNTALGYLNDDQASLVAALAYLGALARDGPGSAAQRALAVHAVLPPWPTRRALLTHPPIRCDAPPCTEDVGEETSAQHPPRVPDAVQRAALVKRCTADPGPPQIGTVPVLQRSTSRCAAPGTRERSNTRNEGDDMTIHDAPPAGGKTTQPMREALGAELARASDDGEGNKAGVLQLIARRLATKALEGDLGAIREIFDRIDGKSVAGSAPEQQPEKVQMQWNK
jgi:hypothetical protein